jgi:hypothetical protein
MPKVPYMAANKILEILSKRCKYTAHNVLNCNILCMATYNIRPVQNYRPTNLNVPAYHVHKKMQLIQTTHYANSEYIIHITHAEIKMKRQGIP